MCHALAALTLFVVAVHVQAAGPTCALLDPDKTPQAALLEAKLLVEPGTSWVERPDIDKILKEQKLQAAFGPQGVSGAGVYFSALTPDRATEVVRVGLPGPAKQVIARLPASENKITRILAHDGRLHVALAQIGIRNEKGKTRWLPMYQWWTLDTDGKNLRQVATDLPGIRHLAVSSHYGLVAIVESELSNRSSPTTVFRVEIAASKK